MMEEKERALAFLRSLNDRALHEQIAQTLVRGMGHVAALNQEGLIVYNRPGDVYMIAAKTREAVFSMCDLIPVSAKEIALHGFDAETASIVRRRFGLKNAIEFVLYAYYGDCPPQAKLPIHPLTEQDADFLSMHYAHAGRPYLAERIMAGVMLGADDGNGIRGFIGEHIEGAIGLLHVLPEYRRCGIAIALEREMIRRTMRRGYVPFAQVVAQNEASNRLQERVGFTRAKEMCYWLTNDSL